MKTLILNGNDFLNWLQQYDEHDTVGEGAVSYWCPLTNWIRDGYAGGRRVGSAVFT